MTACTIVARNYLAHARVLADSYAEHHPGRRLTVLVIDGDVAPFDASGEPFDVVLPSELPLEAREFRLMATIYDALELATAIKPTFLRHLLARDGEPAVYLDPDIEVFAPLDEADDLARRHPVVLVPHTLAPLPADGKRPSAADLASAGVFNLGFVAVGPGSEAFLDWWEERLRRDCVVAPSEGLFVDQRLLDVVPALFDHHVLHDPAWNVAYWNLHEREVVWTGERYEVDGRPLRFFHFSGFDPQRPEVLSRHQGGEPRSDPRASPALARVCRGYAGRLLAAGYAAAIREPYGYGRTANGVPIDRRMRRLARERLLGTANGSLPDPFDAGEALEYLSFVRSPDSILDLPPLRRARLLLATDPDQSSPRRGVRAVRSQLARLLRPLTAHQRLIDASLLEAIEQAAAAARSAPARPASGPTGEAERQSRPSETGGAGLPAGVQVVIGDVAVVAPGGRVGRIVIEQPKPGYRSAVHSFRLGGWAVGTDTRVEGIQVIVDGAAVRTIPVQIDRPDVAAAVEVPRGDSRVGFAAEIGVVGLPTAFEVELRTELADGATQRVATVHGTRRPLALPEPRAIAPILVTSLGRTGTTLLMKMLAEHPNIVVEKTYPYEMRSAGYWFHMLKVLSEPANYHQSFNRDSFAFNWWYVGHHPDYHPSRSDASKRFLGGAYVERLARFAVESIEGRYLALAEVLGCAEPRYFAEKMIPSHLPRIALETYPGTGELFLVRDWRDMLASIIAFNEKRGLPGFGREKHSDDRDYVRALAGDVDRLVAEWRAREGHAHLVRYEDLVRAPEPTVGAILAYLDLPSDGALAAMIAAATAAPDELARHRTSPDAAASIGRWRHDLDPEVAEAATEAFSESLAAFGYELD